MILPAVCFWLAACGGAAPTALPTAAVAAVITPSPSHTPQPAPTATPPPTPTWLPSVTPSPTATPTTTPTNTPIPTPTATPTPRPYLEQYRLVTYYGWPLGRGLGILGNSPRPQMLVELRQVSAQYQALSDHTVLPTFHMVTTVADTSPPLYSYRLGLDTIEEWVNAAEAEGVAVILDLQPGRAGLMEEIERLKPFLYLPHVHLALDPEWTMGSDQIPGVHIGNMRAEQINEVQALLNEIALEIGLNRVLILHQFKDSMLPDKEAIVDFPYVETVIDSDGAFSAEVKISSYQQYAAEPAFEYGGVKLFTVRDRRLLTPDEVMALQPPPVVIIYQ